jgi:hypothetical protein
MWGQKKYVGAAPNQTDQKTTGHVSIAVIVEWAMQTAITITCYKNVT